MAGTLSAQDINTLQQYIDTGDRYNYWSHLSNLGDPYATLALGVVTNSTLEGYVANNYAASYAPEGSELANPDNTQAWWSIGVQLMEQDLRARQSSDNTLNLSFESIYKYHKSVFEASGLPEDAWTPYIAFKDYIEAENWTRANEVWVSSITGDEFIATLWALGQSLDNNSIIETASWLTKTTKYTSNYTNLIIQTDVDRISLRNADYIDGWSYDSVSGEWTSSEGVGRYQPILTADPQKAEQLNLERQNRIEKFGSAVLHISSLADPVTINTGDLTYLTDNLLNESHAYQVLADAGDDPVTLSQLIQYNEKLQEQLVEKLQGQDLSGATKFLDSDGIWHYSFEDGYEVRLNATTGQIATTSLQTLDDGTQLWTKTNFDGSYNTLSISTQAHDGSRSSTIENYDSNGELIGKTTSIFDAEGKPVEIIKTDSEGQSEIVYSSQTNGFQTLIKGIETYSPAIIDALSIVQAVQNGQPLPAFSSTLKLANDINKLQGITDYELGLTSNVASGVLSLMSLDNAIANGDNLAIASSAAQVVSFGAQAYANFALSNGAALTDAAVQNAQGISSTIAQDVLPVLNIIRAIDSGDDEAIAVAVVAYFVPVVGQIYAVYNLVSSIFADGPPDPWGTGQYVWDGERNAADGSALTVSAAGESGGSEAVQGVMDAVVATLNSIIEREREQNPGAQLGLIPNRMPRLGYGLSGYSYTNIDPLTGVEKNPGLRFDTSGNPINAEPGSPESFQSLIEGMVLSALKRGAIAPLWEVETAKLQNDAGDPKAGLTEETRAGRDGQLAAALTGDTQFFRPVALDLDGDGIETIIKSASGISFDVDDSGFQKQTGWIGADDAFLTIDRNYNGNLDSGRELFSNGKVALGRRGLAGMGWVDANYDGKITSADPVWNEINVWQDANSNGKEDDGESQSLADLGITELNYSLGTFKQNGVTKQLGSPDLTADTEGTRYNVVEEGIIIESSNGNISLLVSRVDDKTLLEPNRDGITGFEDIEIIVNSTDLLANDTLGGFTGRDLTITGVSNFVNGTGFLDANGYVHFNPSPNYSGNGAQFKYNVLASNGQTGTSTVDVTVQNVNDAPTLDSVGHTTRAVYGYTRIIYDYDSDEYESGGEPIYEPYVMLSDDDGWYLNISYNPSDFSRSDVIENHTSPVAYEDTGRVEVVGKDIDDPVSSLSYTIANQPQYGEVTINADGTFQYTSWKESGVPSDNIVVSGKYAALRNGTLYTDSNLPSSAVYPTEDVFQITITDPHGATRVENISVPHYGPYLPETPQGGGGKKPIAIDLDGDGFEFVNVDDSNVFFDVNGDGWKQRTSWVGADDGFLAYDIDGDGKIDQAGEISFTRYKEGAQSDLEGLTAFDTNGDGVLSAADEKWSSFGIWQDANQNGVTDDGEFRSLDDMGVASIGLTHDGQFAIINGQTVNGVGSVDMQDGTERAFADVALSISTETAIPQQDGTVEVVNSSPFSPNGEEIHGTVDDDLILGKNGNNIIYGYEGDDVIFEDGGNDVIDAGAGNDLVYAGADNDLVMAQEGDDIVYAGLGDDLVFAGDGDDAVLAEGGNDVVFGGDGNDFISGGFGNDVLSGDNGNDQVYGESGNDALFGRDGNDQLAGMDGYDYLNGGAGNDLLDGGNAADEMIGGAGNDTYGVDDVGDTVTEFADEGTDTVKSSIHYTLGDHVENLTLSGSVDLNGTGNELNNSLKGNEGNNVLSGEAGDDTLNGKAGVDTLIGGTGDDTYIVDNSADTVIEQANEGNDLIFSSASYVMPEHVENMVLTGTSSISGTGNDLDNQITGNNANNLIDGAAGSDVMAGGKGHDNYIVDNTGDVVLENQNQGIDTIYSSVDYTLSDNTENLSLTGQNNLNATGNSLNNIIVGNEADNRLNGGEGEDSLIGGSGDDTYIVDNTTDTVTELENEGNDSIYSSVNYVLPEHVENITLTGTDSINATGNNLNNTLVGNSADNIIDGGSGVDTMAGGLGDDTYIVDATNDVINEAFNEGVDQVNASATYTLSGNVENLTLTGTNNIDGTGNDLNNILVGNSADNIIDGGSGVDTMAGGLGDDTYIVDKTTDVINEAFNEGVDQVNASATYTLSGNVENLTLTGTNNIDGTGNDLNNILVGNSADNIIDGGSGVDTMAGGLGDDTYIVDKTTDVINEAFNEGVDQVNASATYTLSDNVENLTLIGTDNIDGTGNALDNTMIGNESNNTLSGLAGNDSLTGNGGDDILDGGTGVDTMAGGIGNDTYIVDATHDVISEAFNEGVDHVDASVTYTLSDNIESLTLTGTEDINATGNNLDNTILGNSGANLIDGGTGADSMSGGVGDDTYIVDNVSDKVTEFVDEGADTIISSVSYVLPEHVENLTLTGVSATYGKGNTLNNTIVGNDTNNILLGLSGDDIIDGNDGDDFIDGGLGIDAMAGGMGNDTYIVDETNDSIVELAGAGIDHVDASATYTLSDNIESLTLTGTSSINATANALDNTLIGNIGDNQIDGGAGADSMTGGAGDDTYIVDNVADVVIENVDEGTDSIYTSVSYVLPENVENMTLTGNAAINGTGNTLSNIIVGNGSDNTLTGLSGNDTLIGNDGNDILDGGLGDDVLVGGAGNDTYLINMNDGLDSISDISGNDTVRFGEGLSLDNVALRVVEDNGIFTAQVRVLDEEGCEQEDQGFNFMLTSDVNGQFVSPIENFEFADGSVDTFDDLLIKTVEYYGSPRDRVITTGRDDDIIYAGPRNDTIQTGTGNDIVYADPGVDNVLGEGGNDTLLGSIGDDNLDGGCGTDILSGGIGRDTLIDHGGNSALLGGLNTDIISAGMGNDFITGGAHDDIITTGSGNNIVAFNNKDGNDTIISSLDANNILSLGGGIQFDDLSFSRDGDNLILNTGKNNDITFSDWYTSSENQNFVTLQLINSDFVPDHGVENLLDYQVMTFDFKALVQQFDDEQSQVVKPSNWSLMNGLLDAHLSSSDSEALGGELSEQYASNGELNMDISSIQQTLSNINFGNQSQSIGPSLNLNAIKIG